MSANILIHDGNERVRQLVGDVLRQCGYTVVETGDPDDFFHLLGSAKPDVALAANCSLTGGQSLVDRFFGIRQWVPLVLLVDAPSAEHTLSLFSQGVFDYVCVPVERTALLAAVYRAVEHHQLVGRLDYLAQEKKDIQNFCHSLLNSHGSPACLLDPAGHIRDANVAMASALGHSLATLYGQPYKGLCASGSVKRFESALEQVRIEAKQVAFREERPGAMVEVLLKPVLYDRVLVGYLLLEEDITTSMRSEQELAQSEQRYRSVYQAARDAILLVNRSDGQILDTNDAAVRLYGYSRSTMLNLCLSELFAAPEQGMNDLRQGFEVAPLRHHVREDGSEFPAEVSMSHFGHEGQAVTTLVVRDISNRKVVEEALREGARLYRAVVEDQTELICRFDPDFTLTFVNPACTKFFDCDEDDLLGKSFLSLVVTEERNKLTDWADAVTPKQPVMPMEQRTMRPDGEIRWMRWVNRAIFDHRGQLKQFQCVGRDISDRKDAAKALEQANYEKERLRLNLEATFRSIPDGIVTVDSNMQVISTNSAAAPLCAVERDSAPGRPVQDVLQCATGPCVRVLQQVLRTRQPVRGHEAACGYDDGPERMVELNCSPLLDAEKKFSGAVLVIRDISRIADLEKRLQERFGFQGMVGKSEAMQELYHLLEQLSPLESTVLIRGESGTGKELVADALHYGGSRATKSIVKVNCSALSESLLESELFGHVCGAFTGAVRNKVGRIEAAQGGTLFLDEIGDISPLLQVKLLRFLEQKEYEKVGESRTRKADVRIIAATNVDLLEKVRKGLFREDLYYRLNVMPINLPPLRERDGDIPLLVNHFLQTFAEAFKKNFSGVSKEVLELFFRYSWPGNIRELKHIMEHACILAPDGEISINYIRRDLVQEVASNGAFSLSSSAKNRTVIDRHDIERALEKTGGNKAKAAKLLGIHRATLYRKLEQISSLS